MHVKCGGFNIDQIFLCLPVSSIAKIYLENVFCACSRKEQHICKWSYIGTKLTIEIEARVENVSICRARLGNCQG